MLHPPAQSTPCLDTAPKPCPPPRRLQTAVETLAVRSGITVHVTHRQGMAFWTVARSLGSEVAGVRSGTIADLDAGPRRNLLVARLDRAVRQVRANAAEAVYVSEEGQDGPSVLLAALTDRGLATREGYPPAAGLAAAQEAMEGERQCFYSQVVIHTDASAGHRGVTGTGWLIDFGQHSLLRPGTSAQQGGSILEAELRAILFALKDARGRIPHGLEQQCRFHVRTDSKFALAMILDPAARPLRWRTQASGLADAIRRQTSGLQVDFAWVKGHSGDPGNETADRLAVMARRHAENGLDHTVLGPKVEALRAETQCLLHAGEVARAA